MQNVTLTCFALPLKCNSTNSINIAKKRERGKGRKGKVKNFLYTQIKILAVPLFFFKFFDSLSAISSPLNVTKGVSIFSYNDGSVTLICNNSGTGIALNGILNKKAKYIKIKFEKYDF